MKTTTIKTLASIAIYGQSYAAGALVRVDVKTAQELISYGRAELWIEPEPEPEPTPKPARRSLRKAPSA